MKDTLYVVYYTEPNTIGKIAYMILKDHWFPSSPEFDVPIFTGNTYSSGIAIFNDVDFANAAAAQKRNDPNGMGYQKNVGVGELNDVLSKMKSNAII